MFTLARSQMKLSNLNLREEKHGEEDVLACDIKLRGKFSNDFLTQLDAELKRSLYARPIIPDLADSPEHLPRLLFPKLAPLKWTGEITGGTVTIRAAISGNDQVFQANIKGIGLEPEEGGSVDVTFTAQVHPEPGQVEYLTFLLNKTIEVSVEPPSAEDMSEDDQEAA